MPLIEPFAKSVVILKPQYFGDAVMALPLIDAVCRVSTSTAVRAMPHVLGLFEDRASSILRLDARKDRTVREMFRSAREIKDSGFTAAFLVDRSFRSAVTARLARIPIRVGHKTEGRSWLLTHQVPYGPTEAEWESGLNLIRALNRDTPTEIPKLALSHDEEAYGSSLNFVRAVAFQPGARFAGKQFPIERMATVANDVIRLGFEVVIVGGKDEIVSAMEFERLMTNGAKNFVGKTTIGQTKAILKNCVAAVGSDTGVMHIAAALGTPTLTLFGPGIVSKWGHQYDPHRIVKAPQGRPELIDPDLVRNEVTMLLQSR